MKKSSRYIIRIRSSRYLTFDPGNPTTSIIDPDGNAAARKQRSA
jgi:hypothetical protein